jgi:23S rRNA pseudouridine2605 synthase
MSKMGYCSRSQACVLIREGRVSLNGWIVRDPETPAQISEDRIQVDNASVDKTHPTYLMINKARGVVTTASDEKGRKTVYDCLDPELPWVGPVGRLDKASEGLLLLTNDSEWAAKITAPSSHLVKKYHVKVDRVADDHLLTQITRASVVSKDSPRADRDDDLRAKSACLLRRGDKNSWLEITLDEGKNRQIRRLLEGFHVRVLRLVRISIGPLELGDLKKGSARELTLSEKTAIDLALTTATR